jgi:penicillin-binding protein 1C
MQALGLDARGDAMPSVEANLPQLAQALRSLATGGQFVAAHVLAESTPARRNWRADAAFIATDLLADADARPALFAEALPQNAGWQTLWALNAIDEGSAAIIAVGDRQTFAVIVAGNNSGKDSPAHIAARVLRNVMTRVAPQASQPPRPQSGLVRNLVSFEPPVEPPRREWFLRGTEVVQSQPPGATAHAAPAILHPLASEGLVELGDGESLVLEANLAARGAHWRANGQELGEGLRRSWRPDPGHYKLELRGPNGELWDSREFDLSLKAQDDS